MCGGIYLFLEHAAMIYWLLAVPVVLLATFITTLAAVHNGDGQVFVKRWWASPKRILRKDVVSTAESVLEGIGQLRLRRFVPPWGRIYFLREWSVPSKEREIAELWKLE
jgi:hypothetical protein